MMRWIAIVLPMLCGLPALAEDAESDALQLADDTMFVAEARLAHEHEDAAIRQIDIPGPHLASRGLADWLRP